MIKIFVYDSTYKLLEKLVEKLGDDRADILEILVENAFDDFCESEDLDADDLREEIRLNIWEDK